MSNPTPPAETEDTQEQIRLDLTTASNIVYNAAGAESPDVAHRYRALSLRLSRYEKYSQVKTIVDSPREALPEMPADVAHAIREARHTNWRTRLCMDVDVARESVRMLVTAVVCLADLLSHREREIENLGDQIKAITDYEKSLSHLLGKELEKANALVERWIKAALYSTPLNEFSLNFDATNPEAFGESRRAAVDALMTERDALQAQVAALITDKDLLQQKLDKTDAVFVIRCEELDYARAENTKLRQQVLDLTTDKERLEKDAQLLDWAEANFAAIDCFGETGKRWEVEYGTNDAIASGAKGETLREAIRAAMRQSITEGQHG